MASASLEQEPVADSIGDRRHSSVDSQQELPSLNPANNVKRRKLAIGITAVLIAGAIVAAAVGIPYLSGNSNSASSATLDTPSQSATPESTQNKPLAAGDSWDIYLAYFADCAISEPFGPPEVLMCSSKVGWNNYYKDDPFYDMEKYVVPNWMDLPAGREIACATPNVPGLEIGEDSGHPVVDKNLELQVEESSGLLVTAELVSTPILEEATLTRVIDTSNPSSTFYWPSIEEVGAAPAPTERELASYAGGFCVAHFRVNAMPAYSSALKLYLRDGEIEWTLNPDELQSNNFLIWTDGRDDHNLELWDSNNYSSFVESFNR